MKIDKNLIEQLANSLFAPKIESESNRIGDIFNIPQNSSIPASDNSIWSNNTNYQTEGNSDILQTSKNSAFKDNYENNTLQSRYIYNLDGQIVQRQNYSADGRVESVTKYNNGVEEETVRLFTNTGDYTLPDEVFDNIIDPIIQDTMTSDCWFLNALSVMSKKEWGRELLRDAISYDKESGNITIKFKKAYGETKEFTITPEELEAAKSAKATICGFGELEEGTIVYIDGRRELYVKNRSSFSLELDSIKDNVTFISPDGEKYGWTREEIIQDEGGLWERPKYSAGDLTVLALEIAADRSCKEAGFNLGDGAGYLDEVISLFTDEKVNSEYYTNTDVKLNEGSFLRTESQKSNGEQHFSTQLQIIESSEEEDTEYNLDAEGMKQKLYMIKENPDKYINDLTIKVCEGGWHAAEILRFEEQDGKEYIVYAQPWDEKAEIREELDYFVHNTLNSMTIVEREEEHTVKSDSDRAVGEFTMSRKSDRTNFVSAIASLSQISNPANCIKKDGTNFVVEIGGKKLIVTSNELETARLSGRYSINDDDITILEIAAERYFNSKNDNKIYDYTHTDLQDVSVSDILNLFADTKTVKKYTDLKNAKSAQGLKFAVANNSYYAIKEIKQTPEGEFLLSVIQPEDTSIVVTYTEKEFERLFGKIEVY